MLTKTLKFDSDVLEVLRSSKWSDDGLQCVFGQVDRKLYEKVNKALEVMGGKWNRQAKAHVFKFDPRPQVEGLLESGALTVERDGFFETPPAVVARMLEFAPLPDHRIGILEPSAGMGAILKVLIENDTVHNAYYLVEKNFQRAQYLNELQIPNIEVFNIDFLKHEWEDRYSFGRIYMNPTFEEDQDIDHVLHAYKLLSDEGILVSVMSEGPFFRGSKKAIYFREWLEHVDGYSVELPDGSFKESGTGVKTRLVVIRK